MRLLRLILLLLPIMLVSSPAIAMELSGYVSADGTLFVHSPAFPGQSRQDASIALQPEFYHEWADGTSFIFVPFGRIDSADSKRSHADIRELNMLWYGEGWEMRMGIGKVFWGATEFVHLVDIINQTDLVESVDAEEKLGQPMAQFTLIRDWGVVGLFVLPYFRERTFPGSKGRLRTALSVDTDHPLYESGRKQRHVDFAVRYSHTIGDVDFGLYHFVGTGREPTLIPGTGALGQALLSPYYAQINQTGLDMQMVAGEWLWKLEALYRSGQGKSYSAAVGGFEYTIVGIAESAMDLGILAEYACDSRSDTATTPFQNDAMLGVRLAFNDVSDSTLLAGWIQDVQSSSAVVQVEASRRFGERVKASLEARFFLNQPAADPLYSFRQDDHLKLDIAYYF